MESLLLILSGDARRLAAAGPSYGLPRTGAGPGFPRQPQVGGGNLLPAAVPCLVVASAFAWPWLCPSSSFSFVAVQVLYFMAFAITEFVNIGGEESVESIFVAACESAGLLQVIDLAMCDGCIFAEVFGECDTAVKDFASAAVRRARLLVDGWSLTQARAPIMSCGPATVAPQAAVLATSSFTSSRPRSSTIAAAARRFLRMKSRATRVKPAASARCPPGSLAESEAAEMREATLVCHSTFLEYASASTRIAAIVHSGSEAELGLQLEVYRQGSTSSKVVLNRARSAIGFFRDLAVLKWGLSDLTEWRAAAWVHSKVSSNLKTAGPNARQTLAFVAAATAEETFHSSPLVKAQVARSGRVVSTVAEPSVPAVTPSVELVRRLEELARDASSPQERVFAGFFTLLAMSSARCSDAQRSRGLTVVSDALRGESRMKGKRVWVRWFCPRRGLADRDWASPWLEELNRAGMPGPDFILCAANSSLDEWLSRPAHYEDFRRALHLLLMKYVDMSADEAVRYNPHSFRHFLVTAGTQLRFQGALVSEGLESLGHWRPGSAMPRNYDSEKGVTELSTRTVIVEALRAGWRPSAEGEVVRSATTTSSAPCSSSSSLGTPAIGMVASVSPCPATGHPLPTALQGSSALPTAKRLHRKRKSSSGQGMDDAPSRDALIASGAYSVVVHNRRHRVHLVAPSSSVTVCGWWRCGTPTEPSPNAIFGDAPSDYRWCAHCEQ